MKKVLISLLLGVTLVGSLVGCGEETVSKKDYDTLQSSFNDTTKELERVKTANGILETENKTLNNQIESAKDYLELDPTEKELVDAKIKEVNEATETQKEEEKAKRKEEERLRKEAEEEAKRQEEAKKDSHIGETITFTTSDYSGTVGDWTLTINNVYKTDERNMFEDPINQVVVIEYTVENISIPNNDFYCNLGFDAEFYNSDGYKCSPYPGGESVSDLTEGMKANGTAYIGINNDTPYLEMHFGGVTYKWTF